MQVSHQALGPAMTERFVHASHACETIRINYWLPFLAPRLFSLEDRRLAVPT